MNENPVANISSHFLKESLEDLNTLSSSSEINNKAIIESVIVSGFKWRIRYRATSWVAQCMQDEVEFLPEDTVCVVGRYGLTLIIESEKV